MSANQDKFTVRNIIIAMVVASIGYGIYVEIPDSPAQSSDPEVSTTIEKVVGDGNSFVASLVGDSNAVYAWVILGIVGLLLLRSLFSKKKEKGSVVSSIRSFFQMIFGSLGLTIIFGSVAAGVLLVIIIVAGIADGMTDGKVQQQINNVVAIARNEPLPTVDYAGNECDLVEKLDRLGNTLSRQWVEVTLCKDDVPFSVFVPRGTEPEIKYRDQNDEVLTDRSVKSFVEVEYRWGKPGGMPNLYKLSIPRNNGFDTALRDSVTFLVRAAGGTSSTPQPQSGLTLSTQERTEAINVTSCSGKNNLLPNCVVVLFGENEKYTRSQPVGKCLMADPGPSAELIRLGGEKYQYNPYSPGAKMWFYEIDDGQSIFGVKCDRSPTPPVL
jgi:hypothetical protein